MEANLDMAAIETDGDENEPQWRQRAVSRSLTAARSRAELRIQRFLDAAFELIDEKGTTEFTIQEVIDRSKQSLRGFYQYFDGKDELILALFEETVRESIEDYQAALEGVTDPLDRLRTFVVRLHEWCDPSERKRGSHNRVPISEFTTQLAVAHADRVTVTLMPISVTMHELVEAAHAAGAIKVDDTRRAATMITQVVMFSWFGNRIVRNPRLKVDSQHIWEFCLHGLHGTP